MMMEYVLVAFGLSADAFAVSVSSGVCAVDLRRRHALRAALAFGFFQALMPVAGYLAGSAFTSVIVGFDHWIAFGLLAAIGGKMAWDGFDSRDENACDEDELRKRDLLKFRTVLIMAVATSIDALAVGVGYAFVGANIALAALVIGAITFVLCLFGIEFGKRLGGRFERGAEIVGGLVLIGIGLKILIQHLLA